MKSLSLLILLPYQLIQVRRVLLFAFFYFIASPQFLPVSTTPIRIEQKEIQLPQEIKEFINSNFNQKVQGEKSQMSNKEEQIDDGPWETVLDPKLYVITELDTDSNRVGTGTDSDMGNIQQIQQLNRERRTHHSVGSSPGHSLSIVNPLDVLRQRLLLEIARRRMRQSNMQIIANAEILKNIG